MAHEKDASALSGWLVVFVVLLVGVGTVWTMVYVGAAGDGLRGVGVAILILDGLALAGLTVINPNEASVVTLFGVYKGTIKRGGFWWVNPLTTRRKLSLRVRNFESARLKVNDNEGNPIEIAAVVVWQVVDTAEAVFCVDDYENFVQIQTESALRQMAQSYPYDGHDTDIPSLRSHGEEINTHLRTEIQTRLGKAGVKVVEARISHLAYAQEIAQAMLQRQQAGAIIAARTRIVEGAVSMVEMALTELGKRGVVTLDNERRAAMVSNLLVVLCGERATQPVVNTGTLYTG